MIHVLDVTAANGTPFRVVFIPPKTVGPNRFRADGEQEHATVEFFDRRYPFDDLGEFGKAQFTAGSYYASTLTHGYAGLRLNGDIAAWILDADTMTVVRAWIGALLERFGRTEPEYARTVVRSAP